MGGLIIHWAGILFMVIAVVLLVPFAVTMLDTMKKRRRCTEPVEATVVPTRKKDGREYVNYMYDVGEYSYIHQEETYAVAWNDLEPGTTKTLYYDPNDPSEAFDPEEHHMMLGLVFLGLSLFFFAVGAFLY